MSNEQAGTAECGAMGGVVEAHKALEPFVGKFKSEVKIWMGPGDPIVSTGLMINTLDLGNRFLHQVYKGDEAEGAFPNFEGRGYWGYNTFINKYEGFWIDTASTMMQTESGDLDGTGKVWTMTGQIPNPQVGGMMTKKSVITLEDDDHHTLTMFFVAPDGNEFKGMEIRYERAG